MKKGLSLPIELIIIIIVAIVVMIAIVSFFTLNMKSSGQNMDAQQKWSIACSALKMRGCHFMDVETIEVGAEDGAPGTNMIDLCNDVAGTMDQPTCCQVCCGEECTE